MAGTSDIVTRGFGTFGSIADVVTAGFSAKIIVTTSLRIVDAAQTARTVDAVRLSCTVDAVQTTRSSNAT